MTEQKGLIFRFGEFEVREGEFCLIRGEETIPVEPKAFRVLLYLLRNPHRLVTKDELLDAVWQETSVSENSLTRAVALLRRLLGDDTREPRFIATVPTVGYRFLADVAMSSDVTVAGEAVDRSPSDPTAVSERLARERRRHLVLGLAMAGAGLLAICAAVVARRWQPAVPHGGEQSAAATPGMRSTALVSVQGSVWDPALSPDAKEAAFVWDGENLPGDLYVQLVGENGGNGRPLRLTRVKSGNTCCASWSPDGRELAFGVCDDQGGGVFVVPALGGPSRKLTDVGCLFGQAGSPVWTADGKSLFVVDHCTPDSPRGIVLLSLASGEKRCLDRPAAGDLGDWKLALSPDRTTLAFIRVPTAGVSDVYALRLSNGELHQVTTEGKAIWDFMWTPDGQHIVISSSRSGLASVWRIPATGGVMARETVYPDVGSLSADGGRLVYVRNTGAPTTISRADLAAAGGRVLRMTNLISSANESDSQQPSPDGKELVFASESAGSGGWEGEIWKSNADGSDPIQLTSFGGHAGTPRWSPDGKSITFDYRPGPHSQIYTMDTDGRNQRMLTSDHSDNVVPSWSRDGRTIYFSSNRTGRYEIWKKELATGHEIQITRRGGFSAFESYDGSTLYYSMFDGGGIWSVPVGGGHEQRLVAAPHLGYWGHFAVTDTGVYVLDTDYRPGPTILFYDFRRRELTPVLTLPEHPVPRAANLAASRDGKLLLFAQRKVTSSITMVDYAQ